MPIVMVKYKIIISKDYIHIHTPPSLSCHQCSDFTTKCAQMICLLDFTTIMRLSFYHIFEFYILPQLCESMDEFYILPQLCESMDVF
jgi:hypothetical protein